jgi:hypothetical protein
VYFPNFDQKADFQADQNHLLSKYACEHGNASAVRHFAKILGKSINESTVRSMIKQYLRELDHSEFAAYVDFTFSGVLSKFGSESKLSSGSESLTFVRVRFYQPLFKRHLEH